MLSAAACKQDREIKVRQAPKETAPAADATPAADPHAGMPGMAATQPGTGDPHAGLTAEQLAAAGTAIPASPPFTDTPPAHWKKQALSPMRLASYRIEGEGGVAVDISFSILRRAPGSTLANINRWRDQLGLPPIDDAALKQASIPVKTSFGDGIAVEIEGLVAGADAAKDGRMVGAIADKDTEAWFFKMRGNSALTASEKTNFIAWIQTVKPATAALAAPVAPVGTPPPPAAPVAPAAGPVPAVAGDGSLTWQVPAGWALAPAASAMRYATFSIPGPDGAKGELIVSHFPGNVGSDLDNVNRWRQQVDLPPVDAAGLAPLITQLAAGPKTLSVIDVTGTQVRLITGWTRHGSESWFFKLTGPDALIGAEKAKFTGFLESVRFTKPE